MLDADTLERLRSLAGLRFAKMQGTGNDFILIDGRGVDIPAGLGAELARGLCLRARSAGADGLIILSPSDRVDQRLGKVDFGWDFFNADGSSAEMCGNGGRCAARFALDIGLAGPAMVFDTIAGPIRAQVEGAVVKLEMTAPNGAYRDLALSADGTDVLLDGVNTGVPHAVIAVDDLEAAPVRDLGRAVRFHRHFAPAGTNVNFVKAEGGRLLLRTYERGVEDETLACGTGAVASALVAGMKGWLQPPVTVAVRSGEQLRVHFSEGPDGPGEVFLEGAANYVYHGEVHAEAFAWMAY